jgi:hypothetical protein
VRYVAGSGLLLGREQRWLLLASVPDDAVIAGLWAVLGERSAPDALGERVASVLHPSGGDELPSLALVDLTPGAQHTVLLGRGRAATEGDIRRLSVGLDGVGTPLPLLGGIVRAATVEISALPESSRLGPETTFGGPLIDGVPTEIWHQHADPPEPAPTPVAEAEPMPAVPVVANPHTVRRMHPRPVDDAESAQNNAESALSNAESAQSSEGVAPDADHDGHTVMHRPAAPPATSAPTAPPPPSTPSAPPPVDHLHQSTHETVLALRCPAGHPTPAISPNCRICGRAVPQAEPERIPRPRLGLLRLPSGETVPLDRGAIFGRKPTAPPDGEWPHLVVVPADAAYVSRQHLRIELDGWLVVARDLGSRGGSTLRTPGQPDRKMRAFEPYVLEPGEAIDLADAYEFVFEVGP